MTKTYITKKFEKETAEKFNQAKKLKEIQVGYNITDTDYLEHILELGMKEFDNLKIKRVG